MLQLNGNQAGLSHIDHISCPGETSCRDDAAKLHDTNYNLFIHFSGVISFFTVIAV